MNYSTREIQVFNVQTGKFPGTQSAVRSEMKEHFVLALCSFHDTAHFVLGEPTLFIFGDGRKRRIPCPLWLIVLLGVPVHDCAELLPQVVDRFGLKPLTLQVRNPIIDDAGFDFRQCNLAEKRTKVFPVEHGCGVPRTWRSLW